MQDVLVHGDLLDRFTHGQQIVAVHHLIHRRIRRTAFQATAQHRGLVSLGEVAQFQPDREPIQLRLRQWICALVFDRIVGRQNDEWHCQFMGLAIDAHLALGHCLQQCRLRLRRRPVDLVGEQQVGENRPGPEFETTGLHVIDGRAEQIGRQQIRRELHSGEIEPQRGGEGSRDQRLAEAGEIFDEHVATGEHGGEDECQCRALPHHHTFDFVEHRLAVGGGRRGRHNHR
ncbi:Uncharacterised protein [Mycobacterium tuberculosis]|nr:Uncharacterised protein [Mycobacterium tuberculosis]